MMDPKLVYFLTGTAFGFLAGILFCMKMLRYYLNAYHKQFVRNYRKAIRGYRPINTGAKPPQIVRNQHSSLH